ncbi:MAG: glycosyltransferase family 2 protein [Kiritimatiellae bacterium]|nr:glycosyltransferase family 2 protein [Kiritimatiellia bacterium]
MNLVSIIVPVYNGERFLRDLLNSILAQSHSSWECICVNDSSTDNSLAILEEYTARDSRFKCFTKPNGGTGDSRNFGLDAATGDFIMFADQDDLLHPDAMKLALDVQLKTGADVVQFNRCAFAQSPNWSFINEKELFKRVKPLCPPLQSYLTTGALVIYVWQYLYKKEVLEKIRFPKLTGGEDSPFIFDVANQTSNWVLLPFTLYGFRENLSSVSRSIPLWYINNGFTACKIIYQHGKQYQCDEELLTMRTTHDAFYFALSIALRHGRGRKGMENLVVVSEELVNALKIGFVSLKHLCLWQRVFTKMLIKKHYFFPRIAAYTLGYLVAFIRAISAKKFRH